MRKLHVNKWAVLFTLLFASISRTEFHQYNPYSSPMRPYASETPGYGGATSTCTPSRAGAPAQQTYPSGTGGGPAPKQTGSGAKSNDEAGGSGSSSSEGGQSETSSPSEPTKTEDCPGGFCGTNDKASDVHNMADVFKKRCFSCHDPKNKDAPPINRLFDASGKILKGRENAVYKAFLGTLGDVGHHGKMTEIFEKQIRPELLKDENSHERSIIEKWMRKNGHESYSVAKKSRPNTAPPPDAPVDLVAKYGATPPDNLKAAKAIEGLIDGIYQPAELGKMISDKDAGKDVTVPRIWYIGDHNDNVIKGAVDITKHTGEINGPEALSKLNELESADPDLITKEIVLYCGCCPLEHCPYLIRAVHALKLRGYENIRIVNLTNNFPSDWQGRYPEGANFPD